MKKVIKNMTSNWFVFFGYLSLFLLTLIAALQIYDTNYNITNKYREIATNANTKLTLLLNSRENLEAIQTIESASVIHSSPTTAEQKRRIYELLEANNRNFSSYLHLSEQRDETTAINALQQAWQIHVKSIKEFGDLTTQEHQAKYSGSVQQESYKELQKAISSLSIVLAKEIKDKEAVADHYFKRSIVVINLLIALRIAILLGLGIMIFNVVARLREKNKMLLSTQAKLLQYQAHLLASQQISKTGSWEFDLKAPDRTNGTAVTWSEETYRIFGYAPGEVKLTKDFFFSHIQKDDQTRITNAFQKSIESGVPYNVEHKIISRNGETKIIHERSDIFYDSDGKPEKMIGTCQDITERKLAEQRLAESEKEKHCLTDQINKQIINRQKEITRATIKAQEKERLELGRELHDNVNQILSSSKLFIESSVHNPDKQEEMLNRSKSLINTCIEELRKLSRYLTPPSLGDLTLKESIEEIIKEYNQIEGRKTVEYAISDLNEDILSDDLKISLYRIIQEQLNNIRKYAGASKVHILLKHGNNNISLHIEDNGRGFDMQAKRKGLGITNIINRAETFNGGIQIITSPGNGCAVRINFKLNRVPIVPISNIAEEAQLYGTGI